MEKNKKQILKVSIFITSIFIIFLSISYAFINLTLEGTKRQVITAGTLNLVLDEDENNLTIENALPMYDEVGMIQDAFTFRLVNKGATSANYKLKLVDITPETMETDQKCSELGEITIDSPETCRKVNYPPELREEMLSICGTTTEDECFQTMEGSSFGVKTFEELIDLFIEYNILEDTRTVAETYPDNYVTIDFPRLDETDVKYGLTKDGETTIDLLSNLTDGVIDEGTIGASPETIEYSLRLWINDTVTDNETINRKSLTYKIDVEVSQKIEKLKVTLAGREFEYEETTSTFPNFKEIANATNNNGQGIYTYQENGTNIYYWRGAINDNHVIFAEKCWEMVRTTSTGGIKMIYDGEVTDPTLDKNGKIIGGKCTNTGTASQLTSKSVFNSTNELATYVGYMYGTPYTSSLMTNEELTSVYLYGNDVEWNGTEYAIKTDNTFTSTGVWSTDYKNIANGHHYTCLNETGKCTNVRYIYKAHTSLGTDYGWYITLNDGKTVEDAWVEMNQNIETNSSDIKNVIEMWYEEYIEKKGYTPYLEDVVYCNDRSVQDDDWAGWSKDGDASKDLHYSFYTRRINGKPSLSCERKEDRFTAEDAVNGNGLLNYPVGLLTGDEIILAGGQYLNNEDYYLYTGQEYWAMSPYSIVTPYVQETTVDEKGHWAYDYVEKSHGVRPVVSLASGTVFVKGTGVDSNPYVVE